MIYVILALSVAVAGLFCYSLLLRGHVKWLRSDNKSLRKDARFLREELESAPYARLERVREAGR